MVLTVMVNVYPIRYKYSDIEFLMIKRATLSYNWQCVSGSVEKRESPLECAKRELFEETGYIPALILPLNIPHELFTENEEDEGEKSPPQLQEKLKEITIYNFIARIDQPQDPVLNPAEHTDWKWCSFEIAYKIIKWAVEKKLLRFVYNHLN
ncbi:MAG: NUDIX domain-containing protein [Candidatus Hodarchaeales archaeon]